MRWITVSLLIAIVAVIVLGSLEELIGADVLFIMATIIVTFAGGYIMIKQLCQAWKEERK